MGPKSSKSSPPPKKKSSSTTTTKTKAPAKKVNTLTLGKLGVAPKKAVKPMSEFHKPLSFGRSSGSQTPDAPSPAVKEKGKMKETAAPTSDLLWIDEFGPSSEEELAVHKRKVEDVRRWLIDALDGGVNSRMRKYRRVLALTGPAGAGKTATIRLLAKELDIELVEWRNGVDEKFDSQNDYESLSSKFQNFLERASSYHSLSFAPTSVSAPISSQAPSTSSTAKRQLILIEDLPNIIHAGTREAFHAALLAFATAEETPACPIVFIISNTGVRGEAKDERGFGRKSELNDGVDVRSVIPPGLIHSPYFIEIPFNPIAITLLRKAVNSLLDRAFASSVMSAHERPSKDVVDLIVDSANGDIRSAVMALQFACVVDLPNGKVKGKGKGKGKDKGAAKGVLEAITRREQSLALFHLLGKLMYNKRYGDPEEKDEAPYKTSSLPSHLRHDHNRRLSKVDPNVLYADSPVDTSLLSLYVHQNYSQFCNGIDECEGVIANLSVVDTIGEGDAWPLNATLIPHSFQVLAIGTLHSLPSPVPRRGQKTYKPEFFESLSRSREAEVAISDVGAWLDSQRAESGVLGRWSKAAVVLEAGGMLHAIARSSALKDSLPPNYVAFAGLSLDDGTKGNAEVADEDDLGNQPVEDPEDEEVRLANRAMALKAKAETSSKEQHGWLSDDDISE